MVDRLVAPFADSPRSSGLFVDFDGTLSHVVEVPWEARPVEEARNLLANLARRLGVVAVVSGRSAVQLHEWLGGDVEIWGTHGAERIEDGRPVLSELAIPYRDLMAVALEDAAARFAELDLEGTFLEDKGVMIGLHFRAAADRDRAAHELDVLAEELVRRHGLRRGEGKLVYELRPPIGFSKAAVVLERAHEAGLDAAAFVGDDLVDLPGFDALDKLAAEGVHTLRVAVDSPEAPPELLERADVIVDGPAGVTRFLRRLVEACEARRSS